MSVRWWRWMSNRGPKGYSAPFLTLDKFRPLISRDFEGYWGTPVRTLHYWRSGTSHKYFEESDVASFECHLLDKLSQPDFLTHFEDELRQSARQLVQTSFPFVEVELADDDNPTLRDRLSLFEFAYQRLGLYSVAFIFTGRALPTIIDSRLVEQLNALGESSEEHVPMCRMWLTRTDERSWADRERLERTSLAEVIRLNPNYRHLFEQDVESIENDLRSYPELESLLEMHVRAWCWLHFKWIGPVLSRRYFIEGLVKDIGALGCEDSSAKNIAAYPLIERLSPNDTLFHYCHALRKFTELKEYESGLVSRAAYHIKAFRQEIARRFDLDESLTEQMGFIDYRRLLETGQCDHDELERRKDLFLWLADDNEYFLTGDAAEAVILSQLGNQRRHSNQKILYGASAYAGQATGRILKVTELATAIQRVIKGDVLATFRTTPAYMPLITRASAILTQEQGLAQHAVMVARDLQKPCIVGIDDLMDVISEGEYVHVDATKGEIRRQEAAKP